MHASLGSRYRNALWYAAVGPTALVVALPGADELRV
jgi:hypothetical protein